MDMLKCMKKRQQNTRMDDVNGNQSNPSSNWTYKNLSPGSIVQRNKNRLNKDKCMKMKLDRATE